VASKASKRRRKRRRAAAAERQHEAAPDGGGGGDPDTDADAAAAVAAAKPKPASRRRRGNIDDEPPPAPWGSFPLVELTILIGIVMLILGLLVIDGERGVVTMVTGLFLASIGGLELSVREHFAGYRSHTVILAAVPAVAVLAVLFYAGPDGLPSIARAAIGVAVFALVARYLTRIFQARSGGYSFRFSGLRRR
jgi:hypothetical protein